MMMIKFLQVNADDDTRPKPIPFGFLQKYIAQESVDH